MYVVLATAGQELELRAMLNVKRGGLAESEATEVAVKPNGHAVVVGRDDGHARRVPAEHFLECSLEDSVI